MCYTVTAEILQRSSAVQGHRSVFDIGGDDLVARRSAPISRLQARGVSEKKLENFVFLKLETCNLVNTSWCKFTEGDV